MRIYAQNLKGHNTMWDSISKISRVMRTHSINASVIQEGSRKYLPFCSTEKENYQPIALRG